MRPAVALLDAAWRFGIRKRLLQLPIFATSHGQVLTLLVVFSTVGLTLLSIGVYGLISYTVERQTQPIGLRLALGAQRKGILQRIIGEALALAGAGVVVGTIGGLAVSRTISSVLYGVHSNDPVTFATVSALVALVALLAS